MVLLPIADKELILKVLGDAGACPKCCLRFTGDKSPRGYKELYKTELLGVKEEKKCKPNACSVCLGTLQHFYMSNRLDQVVADIKDSGYDATKFSLSLSLPICLSLRQHSLWLHLKDRLPIACLAGLTQRDIVPIKQVWKYVFPDLVASKVDLDHLTGDVTDFFVELVVDWSDDRKELDSMVNICREEYATRAKNVNVYNMGVFSRQGVEKSLESVNKEQFANHYPLPPSIPSETFALSVKMFRNSVFLGGRYCKYSRELPQTPWIINGVRKCETSLEEVIGGAIQTFMGATEVKFLASGREDVDVRMLGTGRPFAFECVNPKKTVLSLKEARQLEDLVNGEHKQVRVNSLSMVTKADITKLKEGEEEKRKQYTALCVTARPVERDVLLKLNTMKDLTIMQETPVRVLHRRSNAVREKVVHSMEVDTEGLEGNLFKLRVLTSAGTYVKELVHGDFSRTRPNLQTLLGCETDILALDVEDVLLEWPPTQVL